MSNLLGTESQMNFTFQLGPPGGNRGYKAGILLFSLFIPFPVNDGRCATTKACVVCEWLFGRSLPEKRHYLHIHVNLIKFIFNFVFLKCGRRSQCYCARIVQPIVFDRQPLWRLCQTEQCRAKGSIALDFVTVFFPESQKIHARGDWSTLPLGGNEWRSAGPIQLIRWLQGYVKVCIPKLFKN